MTPTDLQDQLTKYLTDAHSIERQALAQLKSAPGLSEDAQIAAVFATHFRETGGHERLIAERLAARGAKPSIVKDLVGTLTGKGFGAFAATQPDTPGKLVVHGFSYEHLEEATYDLLGKVAERAGDAAVVRVAAEIESQERAMGDRLAACFENAVAIALREVDPDDLDQQLDKYLSDAHAIEVQALALLEKAPELAGVEELAAAYDEHRFETEEHKRLVEQRLEARGGAPSMLKDAALKLGALNWGAFFAAQPDTPAKLAGFTYAFEHLEIGAYELLRRVAERARDPETIAVAERILDEERTAAERIRSLFDRALDASLGAQGIGAHR
jgi:ferritin-like metal-binding protein YciE